MKVRDLQFREHRIKLCGIEGDRYFEHVDFSESHANGFFIYVLDRCISTHTTAIDVGANIGVTTALLATVIKSGAIHSFEPSPSVYPALVETININRFSNAYPRQVALADRQGTANFFDNPVSASASHLSNDGALGGTTTTVRMMTLDEFVSRERIAKVDFIKIDVEGFEEEVLEGAKHTLSVHKPGVFIEFNSFTLIAYGNKNPRAVLERLMAAFPYVYCFEGGKHHQIADADRLHHFIHENLVNHHCVDDLYCCSTPMPTLPGRLQ